MASDSLHPPGMGYGSGRLGLEAETEVVETLGRLIEFWGFKRALGRVWALLYLAPRPLSAQDIGERLAMSAGAVSMALNELQLWGVVTRVHKPADRKEYYCAEEDIWKMVTRVLSDRELREVEQAHDNLLRSEQSLKQRAQETRDNGGAVQEVSDLEFQRTRVAHLRKVASTGKKLLQTLILTSKLDASPIKLLASLRKR
ncbi:MAG TPA: MarR family transcriptional regulator [Planctomycetota bacterium]|nr:MarR family transcriptional regulator [Planctomycetota bacterium]